MERTLVGFVSAIQGGLFYRKLFVRVTLTAWWYLKLIRVGRSSACLEVFIRNKQVKPRFPKSK